MAATGANPYAELLGPRLADLAPVLRRFHVSGGSARGSFEVVRGEGWISNALATAMGLPSASLAVDVHLNVASDGDRQHWRRRFGDRQLDTIQWTRHSLLLESIGLCRFGFRLAVVDGGLRFDQAKMWMFGLQVPAVLAPRISAAVMDVTDDGTVESWNVRVEIAHPALGLLCRYAGRMTCE